MSDEYGSYEYVLVIVDTTAALVLYIVGQQLVFLLVVQLFEIYRYTDCIFEL